jgi:hypothetical protein
MSEAAVASRVAVKSPLSPNTPRHNTPEPTQNRMTELRVSGHLMTLDAGLFCIFQPPGSPKAGPNGLPGIRVSLAPDVMSPPGAVRITTFREDGWLEGGDGAALVRVSQGPAQVLVTVYQNPGAAPDTAPRVQVLRLSAEPTAGPPSGTPRLQQVRAAVQETEPELVAHVQRTGDVGGSFGEWIGVRGSQLWIEGFGIRPRSDIPPGEIEYQAVLGRGWLSPWVSGGKFCGSRGMALPLLGIRLRLTGQAAKTHDCSYTATFVDGTTVGPVPEGEACEAESLAALEAFQVTLRRRGNSKEAAAPTPKQEHTRRPAKRNR